MITFDSRIVQIKDSRNVKVFFCMYENGTCVDRHEAECSVVDLGDVIQVGLIKYIARCRGVA